MQSLYKQVREALQEAAGNVPAVNYWHYGGDVGLQIFMRQNNFPVIHCYKLEDEADYKDNGNSALSVVLLFLAKDSADSSELEQAELVDQMEILCNQFFVQLDNNDMFSGVRVRRRSFSRATEAVTTGLRCSFTLNTYLDLCS